MRVAVGAGLAILAAKAFAWHLTGSAAMLADAVESTVNVAASLIALLAIRFAARPPDRTHPYGHGKLEYVVAAFEGGLVAVAALALLWQGITAWLSPAPLQALGAGLMIIAVAGVANGLLGRWLIAKGRLLHSPALKADGYHLLADFWTTAGVLVALGLVGLTGWAWLDPAAAVAVALHLGFVGWRLVRRSLGGLLDETDQELLAEFARHLARIRGPLVLDVHRVRALQSGSRLHLDAHIVLPETLTLREAHDTIGKVESSLVRSWQRDAEVAFHVDPCLYQYCRWCAVDGCPWRLEPFSSQLPLTAASVVATGHGAPPPGAKA